MQGGFSFDGVDIADLGLEYVPDNANTYVWGPAAWQGHEQSFEGHDGAYFYGTTVKPKDFVLRCIYEDTLVTSGSLSKVFAFFKRGRSGKLVFQRRPWIWYLARITSIDARQMTNKYNGVLTINMRAYYPFGRTDYTTVPPDYEYAEDMVTNSGMIPGTVWDTSRDFAADGPITEQKEFILYNPGSEDAPVAIEIAGDTGDGVRIANVETGQKATFVALTKTLTTNANKYLTLDSMNGKALLTNGLESHYAFLYHDNGVINLKSAFPVVRDVEITAEANSHTIYSDGKFTEDMKGKYIGYLNSDTVTYVYTYSPLGYLQTSEDENGISRYSYTNGVLTSIEKPDHSMVTFTYDANGKLTEKNDAGIVSTYTYDESGRLLEINENGVVRQYTYNSLGLPATLTQNGSILEAYTYNAHNRLTTVTYGDGRITKLTYNDNDDIMYSVTGTTQEIYTYRNNKLVAVTHATISEDDAMFNNETSGVTYAEILDVVSPYEITVSKAATENIATTANIMTMNKIVVTPLGESMELTRLVFRYKPTFS